MEAFRESEVDKNEIDSKVKDMKDALCKRNRVGVQKTAMRSLHLLSALLLTHLITSHAQAAPRSHFLDTGRFLKRSPVKMSEPSPALLEKVALSLVKERVDTKIELREPRHLRLAQGERVVKIAQWYRGLPVALRGAAVTFATDGAARLVGASLEDTLPEDIVPAFDTATAAEKASKLIGLPMRTEGVRLAIWPGVDGGQLAYVVSGRPIPELPLAPVVVLDAKSGEIIVRFDAALSLHKTKMYPSNPKKSPNLEEVTLSIKDGETSLVNDFVVASNCIDKKSVKDINFSGFNLQAHLCDLIPTATPDNQGDYFVDPPAEDTDPEDTFAEISIFHHTNKMMELFRSYAPDFTVQTGAIQAIANLRVPQGFDSFDLKKISDPDLPLAPFQNAFFAPDNPLFSQVFGIQGGAMWFGQGPKRDYSYDGDVVYHEFTHAAINATIQLVGTPHRDIYGISVSPGAMNEGLADYFSSVLTGDPDVGEYASTDFAPNEKSIRSLTNTDTCPSAIGGEVHQDATLFSGSLWDVRATLPPADQNKMDAAIFSAMSSAPSGDLGYEDLAKLIQEAVKASLGQATAEKLGNAFTKRGILPQCNRILEHIGKPHMGPKELMGGWFSLGTNTTSVTKEFNPGVVQFHKKLDAGTTKLTVTFKKSIIASSSSAGNIFGGGGTPFTPIVGVHYNTPITYNGKPFKPADPVITATPTLEKSTYTAVLDVPEGATDVYVMIGNKGQQDGAYTAVDLITEGANGEGGAGGVGGAGGISGEGGAGGGDDAAAGAETAGTDSGGGAAGSAAGSTNAPATSDVRPSEDVEGGCGCRTAPAEQGGGWLALATLGLLFSRRRK